ncbi:type I glyceraldehyde-3-phosphate dehydrogenase [Kitasatospora kifunensis]|uniref:Glyceraldehyde 3-phosphate dehydrogenase n=1 Tax=Kitasatospora kifunensis TaxID=58351 RepID=A0A7W7VT66_KITKI|nr:aldehyde dehydrogenase [Kitasatospora kifunensis]MBB4921946.1 glyceraldehyde 3-phosphate dehydrogenase [Kitasatospora kifunensis]
MAVRVGINGLGRTGRAFIHAVLETGADIEIAGVNDPDDNATLARLFKDDMARGRARAEVSHTEDTITVGDHVFKAMAERDPAKLPWGEFGADVVIETADTPQRRYVVATHLAAGAKKVIVSAPVKEADVTLVVGVNQDQYDTANHHVISAASILANCAAPMAKVLHGEFGIADCVLSAVHSGVAEQHGEVSKYSPDPRIAWAAAGTIAATGTDTAACVAQVLPALRGKLDAGGVLVPLVTGSLIDLVVQLDRDVTREEVNDAFRTSSTGALKGVLDYLEDPVVSSDVVGRDASCLFDPSLTTTRGRRAKVTGWFDGWGYANRLLDLALFVGAQL